MENSTATANDELDLNTLDFDQLEDFEKSKTKAPAPKRCAMVEEYMKGVNPNFLTLEYAKLDAHLQSEFLKMGMTKKGALQMAGSTLLFTLQLKPKTVVVKAQKIKILSCSQINAAIEKAKTGAKKKAK